MLLPGTGAIYLSQTLEFLRPVRPGDTLTTTLQIESIDVEANEMRMACRIERDGGEAVIRGTARVGLIRGFKKPAGTR